MRSRPAIIDTNVLVAGLTTSDPDAPTAHILDGMLGGRFPFLLSVELLAEYRQVLLRRRVLALHGLTPEEVDSILTMVAANAIIRETTEARGRAPDPYDQHVWNLLAGVPEAILVTGDATLIREAPPQASVVVPRTFVEPL